MSTLVRWPVPQQPGLQGGPLLPSRIIRPPAAPAVELRNDFEGAHGSAVTTANSGGGGSTAFTAVVGSVVYDTTTFVSGSSSAHCSTTTSTSACEWLDSVFVSAPASWYGRLYFRLSATTPPAVMRMYEVLGPASSPRFGIGIDHTSGKVIVRDVAAGLTRGTLNTVIPATLTWHRLEFHATWDGSNRQVELRLYAGANLHGTSADDSALSSSWADTNAAVEHEWGIRFTSAQTWDGVWLDAIGLSDTDWIGPVDAPTAPPPPPLVLGQYATLH